VINVSSDKGPSIYAVLKAEDRREYDDISNRIWAAKTHVHTILALMTCAKLLFDEHKSWETVAQMVKERMEAESSQG
jgi:hypothetical protein